GTTVVRLAITVEMHGASPPIVLLHSLALDRSMWSPLIDELDPARTVITMDLRGHGRSPTHDSFTIEDMADDVADTVGFLGHDQAVVVGLSMGGCVALAVAIRHRSLVTGLGLIDTTAWYGPDAPERWAERATKAQEQGMASLSQFQLERWFGPEFLAANRESAEVLLDVFAKNHLDSYVAACHAMGAFDARAELGAIAAPTVVIVGELDPATSPEHADRLHQAIPGSTLNVIAGAKHLTPVECPAAVAALLAPLWTGSPRRGETDETHR
ncbi:MAG TPA: alpha/beta fold hydrolase, partial [Acidimicrobiia bacterium]|nr:alpha/beta fold hydrolase [Acidimicrobiia bacterium]